MPKNNTSSVLPDSDRPSIGLHLVNRSNPAKPISRTIGLGRMPHITTAVLASNHPVFGTKKSLRTPEALFVTALAWIQFVSKSVSNHLPDSSTRKDSKHRALKKC